MSLAMSSESVRFPVHGIRYLFLQTSFEARLIAGVVVVANGCTGTDTRLQANEIFGKDGWM